MSDLTDDRLREIVAAAEVLHREGWGFVDSDDDHRILIVRAPNDAVVAASTDYKRASFIALADPSTVAAMAEELLALREAAEEAKLAISYAMRGTADAEQSDKYAATIRKLTKALTQDSPNVRP